MPIDRKYTGYRDKDVAGYTGMRANIDYTVPDKVCYQTNTWIGADDVSNMVWVQIGWAYEIKPSKRIANYAEVHRHDKTYNIYYSTPLVGGVTYQIEKSSDKAVWTIGNKEIHSEKWSKVVGTGVMPNMQYTVEVFDPSCDYVPGSSTGKNYYKKISTRATGGSYAKATLATDQTDDPNGKVEKNTGSGDMWMAVWDSRAATGMTSNGKPPPAPETVDATPSVTWETVVASAVDEGPLAAAVRLVGATPDVSSSQHALVRMRDAFPFGAPEDGEAHRFAVPGVAVDGETPAGTRAVEARIDLLLDPETLGLRAAATVPKPRWAAPAAQFPPADPERELRRIGIEAAFDPRIRPKLRLRDVLAAVWRDMGIPVDDPGQIVMRPRVLQPTFPRQRQRGGKTTPERPAGLYWIVEVRGTVVHEIVAPDGQVVGRQTGLVILVDDDLGDAFYAVGLP